MLHAERVGGSRQALLDLLRAGKADDAVLHRSEPAFEELRRLRRLEA
ncbi:hypothetical protein NUV25_01260 [Burkholderia pseudomultivorans]|nr:hypothetical protein [Burkholderia pseudomultivorans]MDS0856325.1 hypothetical protein [Burkholderia pseudomultivorans]